MKKIPYILTEIEGLIMNNNKFMANNEKKKFLKDAIIKMTNQKNFNLVFLANKINKNFFIEEQFKNLFNEKLNLNNTLNQENFLLNYSHLKNFLTKSYSNLIMLIGNEEKFIHKFAEKIKIKNYITLKEYTSLFPELVPLNEIKYNNNLLNKITKRTNLCNKLDFSHPFQIDSIFLIDRFNNWEIANQVHYKFLIL